MSEELEALRLLPEGYGKPGIQFDFGWTCGRQRTPSVSIRSPYRRHDGTRVLAGGVLTHADVYRLHAFLGECIKRIEARKAQ